MTHLQEILKLVKKHENWRKNCINLIASENIASPLVRKALATDFGHRYAEGFLGGMDENTGLKIFNRYYQGTKYYDKIEAIAIKLAEELFECDHANVVPISGVIANMTAYIALASHGDKITALSLADGGHISHCNVSAAGVLGLKHVPYAFDTEEMNIDVDKSKKIVLKEKPKIMLFGASVFLFPHPVKEMKEVADEVGAKIVYDAAHVLGLIAGKKFQDPFREGADVVTSSTHKTFPGPQGGIVLCKEELAEKIDNAAFPRLTSNHHLHRVVALAISLIEMMEFGKEYAAQIIKNAKKLAQSLYERGFEVLCEHKDFTESHQILVDVSKVGKGKKVAELCESANIILNKNLLPWDSVKDAANPSGIRIGVQEVTRLGMKEKDMENIAELMERLILKNENPKIIKTEVLELMSDFMEIKYCFSNFDFVNFE
ncbi:MAG TPA: serine hydroxymethyltransferase [Candidatus Altiarchaeales archaeon]|nr:serine hydroxymethyltransferase [Candidatus Altiarchaeales archaeon]